MSEETCYGTDGTYRRGIYLDDVSHMSHEGLRKDIREGSITPILTYFVLGNMEPAVHVLLCL